MLEEDEILDFTKTQDKGLNVLWLYAISLSLFMYWFVADYLLWPFGDIVLFFGMAILLIAAIIRLRKSRDNKWTSYAYFMGRIVLILGVLLHVLGYPQARYLLWISFAFFGIGLITLFYNKRS